ncbi:MAG TPA: hypothetical protein VK831_03350 [Candidatus Deferrimicrobiaceae bacterium]|nr:hypothetical protein [Candidatus Deferrimicrobiaceae bacterium]
MSAERDANRIVRSWLREDGRERADRVLRQVLEIVDTTPQRRPWWPTRRIVDMPTYAKLPAAAAAVVVVAVIGISLLPGAGFGGPGPTPTPTAAPSPSLRAGPTPIVDALPSTGPLEAGRYSFSQNGVHFSLDLPTAGWTSGGVSVAPDGGMLTKMDRTAERVWLLLWSIDGVYADPCNNVPAPPVSPSAAALAAAVAGMPGLDVATLPVAMTLGGHDAWHVVVQPRADAGCLASEYRMWYDDVRCGGDDPCYRYATALGSQVNSIWIFEVDGTHVWIEAETFTTAGPETLPEVQQIIESIEFE